MRLAILFLLSVLLPSVANAEARIALLIGNQRYSAKVKAVGFNVTEVKDADYRSADTAIKRHIAAVRREGQGAITASSTTRGMVRPILTPRSTI
jgi:hypothetical protein